MKYAGVLLLIVLSGVGPAGAQNSLKLGFAEGAVSIEADRVGLGSLLAELDAQAGTTSTIPSEFQNRIVSVWVENQPLDRAITKIFEGLALDYAVVGGNHIVVLAESRAGSGAVARTAPTLQPVPQAPATQPLPGIGTFQIPGARNDAGENDDAAAPGRGGRGGGRGGTGRGGGRGARGGGPAAQLVPFAGTQPAPGPVALPTQAPGQPATSRPASTTPFGVPLNPANGAFQTAAPIQSILGNTSPLILDLTQPVEAAPNAPAPRPLPGMPSQPAPAGTPPQPPATQPATP